MNSKDAERCNLFNNTWEDLPELNMVREAATAVALNNAVYVFCGKNTGGRKLNSIEKLAYTTAEDTSDY